MQESDFKKSEPLKKHSTFNIGGPADFYYELSELEKLPELLAFAKQNKVPYYILGGGSNILFHDEGFRGLIIKIKANKIEFNGTEVTADAGTSIATLIIKSIDQGLTGLEPWVGLPGTVGAALRGNAGCNGLETKDILKEALLLDPQTGKTTLKKPEFFNFDYRYSILKETPLIVLKATFTLSKSPFTKAEQLQKMSEIRSKRIAAQPKGSTLGSFFKNPDAKNPAGLLIEKAGLKGLKIGNAQISEKHANFFMNLGGATQSDIIHLAKTAVSEVKKQFNITLVEEVQILDQTKPLKLSNLS